jgi:hypothetical protein
VPRTPWFPLSARQVVAVLVGRARRTLRARIARILRAWPIRMRSASIGTPPTTPR